MCEPEWKGGLLGSVLYFFWCVSLLFVPRLADKFGRRWLYLVSRICESLLYIASMFTKDYWVMLGIMSTFGLAAAGRINVSTVYLQEWVPRKYQTTVSVISVMEQSVGTIINVLLMWFVTQDTYDIRMIGLVLCLVSIPATIILPESPRLLAAKGRVQELEKAFVSMAWFNRKKITLTEDRIAQI